MKKLAWLPRVGAEFAVIVVGVLTALAIEGMWQSWQDSRSEAEYLVALRAEAESNLAVVTASVDQSVEIREGLGEALRLADAGLHADSAALFLDELVGTAAFLASRPQLSLAVFEDLESTGNLRLIHDVEIRRAVQYTHTRVSTLLERLSVTEDRVGSGLYSLLAGHLPAGVLSPRGSELTASADRDQLRRAALAIAAAPEFREEVNRESERLRSIVSYLSSLRDELGEYVTLLESFSSEDLP